MTVKIPEVKIYPKLSVANVKKQFKPHNIVSALASDGFLPVIALEAFVEAGRTYQAYKRGGFDEARERITEEFSGAVFWLGGVTGLNWLFEKLGKKMLGLPKEHTVDIASDEVRKPLDNFLAGEKRKKIEKAVDLDTGKTVKFITEENISPKLMARFKFAKVISSVLIANAFIGFILPKINQAITRSYHKNDKNNKTQNPFSNDNFIKRPDFATFAGNNDKKDISFKGLDFLKIANAFENNRNVRLLSVDAGTASGRAISARNNNERVEILFRDLSSIYFYMFCMGHLNGLLNRIEQGWKNNNTTRLDASSAKFATEYMQNYLDGREINIDKFEKAVLGVNKKLPDGLKTKLDEKKIITLDEFKAELPKITKSAKKQAKLEKIAQKMSELQPQIKGKSILTAGQVKNILNGGLINNPEFLKAFYTNHFGNTKFMQKYKYISQNSLEGLKDDLKKYVNSIIEDARKTDAEKITTDMLKKASKKNFRMNLMNWGAGFAVSALFLSTLIPKIQYLITKLRTGEDNFPGTEQFRQEEVKKAV